MSYAQKVKILRDDIKKSVQQRNALSIRKNVQEYVRLLGEMLLQTRKEAEKNVLLAEIEKYKKIIQTTEKSTNDVSIDEGEWITEIFEKNLPATLVVETESSSATGFCITKDGWALTNYHVIDGAEVVFVQPGDGTPKKAASVEAFSQSQDVALLKVDACGEKMKTVRFIEDYSSVKPGASMVLIGNALSYGLAPISGTIKFPHEKKKGDLIYTAPANVGDSGAPVFNRQGLCIGINKSATIAVKSKGMSVNTCGLTNATPSDEIKNLLNKWTKQFKFDI